MISIEQYFTELSLSAKECSKCGEMKHVSHFSREKRHRWGVSSFCKLCRKKIAYGREITRSGNGWSGKVNDLYLRPLDEGMFAQGHPISTEGV